MEKRLTNIEERLAWQEDLIDSLNHTVSELNQQLAEQQRIIQIINAELQRVQKHQSIDKPFSLREEIPPHY
ncbi:SlyX family protein [Suttonella ornithocola]|uniref:SlyX n=1 Tax=Suttonella ornithocola TaxID=279832 RepID=A0A380MXG1_9GAMM|nr:SlyX family protein [Suttonella ornithocola]SUO97249.1 SlyX [Suttonella ornithocola]